jgi:hypothetical protein
VLDGIKRKLAGAALWSLLKSLATSKDTQTTLAGLLAGAVLAIANLNREQLLAGDPHQIAILLSGLALWALGIVATKERRDGHATFLGTLAGSLHAWAAGGNLESLLTGVAIALAGYLTNKPVQPAEAKATTQ